VLDAKYDVGRRIESMPIAESTPLSHANPGKPRLLVA
jgi:hypothetical protein